jgi:hypothetical protein
MIGKRNGEKFTTQRATKVAPGGFPDAGGCYCAIELAAGAASGERKLKKQELTRALVTFLADPFTFTLGTLLPLLVAKQFREFRIIGTRLFHLL